MKPIQRGINVVIYLNGIPLAGQLGAILNQSASPIDITNKIDNEWAESIIGLKTWNISCDGLYILNSSSFEELINCFMNNKELTITIPFGNMSLTGQALITDFPLDARYSDELKYSVRLLGTGPLKENEII